MPEIDELDVLQKELEGRNFIKEAEQMANTYENANSPNRGLYLSTIRQNLERENAAPASHFRPTSGSYMHADLPPHIPHGEGKRVMLDGVTSLKDEYI